jgi:hypothetical protein
MLIASAGWDPYSVCKLYKFLASCAMFPSTNFIFVGIPEGEDDELDLEVENIEVAKPLTLELAATDSRTRCH